MKPCTHSSGFLTLVALLVAAVALSACGGGSGPEDREFDLLIRQGRLETDPPDLKVEQGDRVTLRVDADVTGTIHLHGYDLELEVTTGEMATLGFEANATGSFNIALHVGGDGSGDQGDTGVDVEAHTGLFESPTLAKGESYSFTVGQDLAGATVPYHNHMNHDMKGTISVSVAAELSGTVAIRVLEGGAFEPAFVKVKLDTALVWTNVGDTRARIASGLQPSTELDLGSLQVYPK